MDNQNQLSKSAATPAQATAETHLEEIREVISTIQSNDLNEHTVLYEQMHAELERALRSIDGK